MHKYDLKQRNIINQYWSNPLVRSENPNFESCHYRAIYCFEILWNFTSSFSSDRELLWESCGKRAMLLSLSNIRVIWHKNCHDKLASVNWPLSYKQDTEALLKSNGNCFSPHPQWIKMFQVMPERFPLIGK